MSDRLCDAVHVTPRVRVCVRRRTCSCLKNANVARACLTLRKQGHVPACDVFARAPGCGSGRISFGSLCLVVRKKSAAEGWSGREVIFKFQTIAE